MLCAALTLVACGGAEATAPSGSETPGPCPTGGGSAVIDWVDFFVIGDIHYNSQNAYDYEIAKQDVGRVVAETRCRMSENVSDPDYLPQDGDAGYLAPGTEIHELEGYDPSFRVVVKTDGEWRIYESDTAPGAESGRDLLDLEGKVRYIGVNSVRDGRTELAAIREPAEVERLVEMVLSAPVDQDLNPKNGEYDEQVFVAFHFEDGSATSRAFYPTSRLLSRGIVVPQEFADAIVEAKEGA